MTDATTADLTALRSAPRRAWLRGVVGLLCTALFVALFLRDVDLDELTLIVRSTELRVLIWALPPLFLSIWIRAVRLRVLLRGAAPNLTTGYTFQALLIGYTTNALVPLRIGELVRAYLLARRGSITNTRALAAIVVEHAFDVLALLLIAIPLAPFAAPYFEALLDDWNIPLRSLALLGAALGAAGLMLSSLGFLAALVLRRRALRGDSVPVPLERLMASVQEGFQAVTMLRNWRVTSTVGTLSLAVWLTESLAYYVTGLALGIDRPLVVFMLVMSVSNLASAVPAASASIGPFDWAVRTVLVSSSIAVENAAAYAVVLHATIVLPVLPVGLLAGLLVARGGKRS